MHDQMTRSCHLNLFFSVWWNPHCESTSVTTSAPIWLDCKWFHLSWLTPVQISKKTQSYQTLIITIALIQPEICYSGRRLSLFVTHSAILAFFSRGKNCFFYVKPVIVPGEQRLRLKCSDGVLRFPNLINAFYWFQACREITSTLCPPTQKWVPFRKATLVK